MQVQTFDTPQDLAEAASDHILRTIQQKPDLLLCPATGNTPTLSYQRLAEKAAAVSLDKLRLFKLDEWGGVHMDHSGTCETYLQQYLISPLQISSNRYFSFLSNPADPKQECERVQNLLEQQGPIDLCILGLGVNGHLAFNEPEEFLQPHCHVAQLTDASLGHSMAQDMDGTKLYGLTLGMSDILASKEILLLISGASKMEITRRLLEGKISTHLPGSFLWLHPKVRVLVC
jgi:galactosamine-6-phosphate isomerase